jgi:hypothetical protein
MTSERFVHIRIEFGGGARGSDLLLRGTVDQLQKHVAECIESGLSGASQVEKITLIPVSPYKVYDLSKA